MSQPTRRPHPAHVAMLAASAAVAATILTQKATQQPHTIGPGLHQAFQIGQPGVYQATGNPPQVTLTSRRLGDVCVFLKADNVTVRDVATSGGYRGFQMNDRVNERFERCSATGGGALASSPQPGANGPGGNDWFTVNSHGLVLDHCQGLNSNGSHALYLSNWGGGTTQDVQIISSAFSANPPASVFQINTETGGPTRNIHITDTSFSDNGQVQVLNLLGVGTPGDPVTFTRCPIRGGRRAVVVSTANGRPSYVVLQDCPVTGDATVEGNSRLWLKGSTKISGRISMSGGGRVLH